MADGIFYPAVSGDDGYIHSGGSFNNSGVGGTMGDYSGSPAETFFRFANVTIPQGSTISAAFVRFICLNPRNTTVCNLKCHMNAHDNAVAPTNYAGFNALSLTTGIAWDALPEWIGDTAYDTPSIITEIQSVIDRVGFVSGNAIMAILKNNSSSTDARRDPSAVDYLSGAEKAELHVTWTEPATGEISEEINVLSEFGDNFGELDEDVNVLSEFDNNWPEVDENVSVNSEFEQLSSDDINEEASVNSKLIAEYIRELSENASVNAELISEHTGELSEDTSVNSGFVCYQRPANINATLPMITADLLGGQGGFLDATLPLITADIKSGAILEASLPVITASLEGKVGAVGNIDATLPKLIANIKGKVETLGNVDAELPAIRAYIAGITGNLATCEATLPMILADMQGVNDLSGDINAILPMIEPYIVGTIERAVCLVLRYDDLPDCIGDITASIPMIEASITEA